MSFICDEDSIKNNYRDKSEMNAKPKNLYCKIHPLEKVTMYCYPCKEPICIECLRCEHKSLKHHYESICSTELRLNETLLDMNKKIIHLEEIQPPDEKIIHEIDFQCFQVEDKINKTYEALENLLKTYRDKSLVELKELQKLRKNDVVEASYKINECREEIEKKIQQCMTQLLNTDNLLDHISIKEKLIKELTSCVDKISESNGKFLVDFNQFNENYFIEMTQHLDEAIGAKMYQRIYHSSNPFIDEIEWCEQVDDDQPHNLNIIEETDIDCNSSQQFPQFSTPNQEVSEPSSPERIEEPKTLEIVEEKSNTSAEMNELTAIITDYYNNYNSVREDVSKISNVSQKKHNGYLNPKKLKLVKKFNDKFSRPQDLCLNAKGEIVIADTGNHRIGVYDLDGRLKLQFGKKGSHDGYLLYPKYLGTFINNNTENYGKIVIYDQVDFRCRIQIFTESGVFSQSTVFQSIGVVKALTTTVDDDRIIIIDTLKQIFIISDNLVIRNKIDCTQILTTPLNIAMKGKVIFITDLKNQYVSVINDEGKFLGRISCNKSQVFANPQGVCLLNNKLIFNVLCPSTGKIEFYEHTGGGSCNFVYKVTDIKVILPDRFEITKDGTLVLLNKSSHGCPEVLILQL